MRATSSVGEKGLDDVVGGAARTRPCDGFVASVGGDEDDRLVGKLGHALHQFDAVGVGQHQVEKHEMGPLGVDEGGQVVVVAGHQHLVSHIGKRAANEAQRLRVIVNDQDARALPSRREGCARPAVGSPRAVARFLGNRDREGEAGALAGTTALGADAPAMRFHHPLADGEPETAADAALGIVDADAGVLAEQVCKLFGRDAPALVVDRNRDMEPVADRLHADGGALARVPRGVGEKVVQHLNDAPPVGHHRGQVGRKVDENVVPSAAGQERVPRPIHQGGHLRGLRRDREGARIDASGIEKVADKGAHVIGVLDDDAAERVHLRSVQASPLPA